MIQLVDVYKAFGPKRVLEGFTLDVAEGETMVIIGYSGTGKSVAIKHIVGLLEPDSGEVVGRRPRGARALAARAVRSCARASATSFSSPRSSTRSPSARTSRWGCASSGELDEREIAERVDEALDLVDLPDVGERFPAELSGGMRKRVGIARAIALRPKYILYDEPTTGLDPVTSAVIDQLMVRMREKLGVTSIVITHDMRSAYTVGTRIAMLYRAACARWARSTRSSTRPIRSCGSSSKGAPTLDDDGGVPAAPRAT